MAFIFFYFWRVKVIYYLHVFKEWLVGVLRAWLGSGWPLLKVELSGFEYDIFHFSCFQVLLTTRRVSKVFADTSTTRAWRTFNSFLLDSRHIWAHARLAAATRLQNQGFPIFLGSALYLIILYLERFLLRKARIGHRLPWIQWTIPPRRQRRILQTWLLTLQIARLQWRHDILVLRILISWRWFIFVIIKVIYSLDHLIFSITQYLYFGFIFNCRFYLCFNLVWIRIGDLWFTWLSFYLRLGICMIEGVFLCLVHLHACSWCFPLCILWWWRWAFLARRVLLFCRFGYRFFL